MPFANAIALDTSPGQTRRQVWSCPEVKSHSRLVLACDRLHAAPLAGEPEMGTRAAIEAGADLDELFGPDAVAVDYVAIRHAKLDLLTNSLIVEYAGGGNNTRQLTVVFASPEAADACFTKLWQRIG